MPEAFICDGVRTPIGRYAGGLAKVRTDDLAAVPIKALMKRYPNVDWSALDEVIYGCANQAGRITATSPAWPRCWPVWPVNRSQALPSTGCVSSQCIWSAAQAIKAGDRVRDRGRVESMTRAPLVMGKAQEAFQRSADVYDTTIGWLSSTADEAAMASIRCRRPPRTSRRITRSRADQDACVPLAAARAKAQAAGYHQGDRGGDGARGKAGPVTVDRDEHLRPDTAGRPRRFAVRAQPLHRDGRQCSGVATVPPRC